MAAKGKPRSVRRSDAGPRGGKSRADKQQGRSRQHAMPAQHEDSCLLEGRHAFEEAIAADAAIEEVFVTDAVADDEHMAPLLQQARKAGARVLAVDADRLAELSSHGAHQGVMARLKPHEYVGVKQLIAAAAGHDDALIVATDHVTDAGNFGAIVRTAEVVGATGVLIPNKRSARVNTASYKTSAGAVLHLPIAVEANLVRSLEALKAEGFWVVGASEHATDVVWDAQLSGRIVLVMGSEDAGLSRLVLETCDLLVRLPQAGKVESLNVAQATTALAYEWMRQCSMKGASA